MPADVVWTYSGVRPLVEDASAQAKAVTRDYRFELDREGAPLLSIFGGKITTFRKLAEEAVDLLAPLLENKQGPWTAQACLPGGDVFGKLPDNRAVREFGAFVDGLQRQYGWLPARLVARYARAYGTRIHALLDGRGSVAQMGEEVASGLYAAEIDYLRRHEWAVSAADILWRRSKLGLHLPAGTEQLLDAGWRCIPCRNGNRSKRQTTMPRQRARRTIPGGDDVQLDLSEISKQQGADTYLYPMSLALVPGAINVLLGTTRAGKTTLMRVMAGLDKPTSGKVVADGVDVTGVPVSRRNLAMVYQQFINYPAFSVYDNMASPLRLRKEPEAQIRGKVLALAERLHITPYLERRPGELSGGQQQRTALGRALIKDASLLLLDEPLVNLDYKLREELRRELTELFSSGSTTVVYATTEPLEALQLGGHVAVLHEGRLLQQGRTLDVFNAPNSIAVARTFSDPPINLIDGPARRARRGAGGRWPVDSLEPTATGGPGRPAARSPWACAPTACTWRRSQAATWRSRRRWTWPKSAARKPMSTRGAARWRWWRSSAACTTSTSAAPAPCIASRNRCSSSAPMAACCSRHREGLEMARIELVELAHAYKPNPSAPTDYALRPMSMSWQDGGAYALLGPSGCGKTTLLNIISGLVKPSHGKVLFDGKDVTQLPTEARNIAQVFQFPVIYDTMTVHDNLAFPLRNRGWKEAEVKKRVQQVAQMLELSGDLKMRASGLSVDAKQKISLGRGLVRPDVAAVLFDEPLTVIDPHLKWLLRRKLKEIHHELKLSLIYVTHDQVEALTFADQVVVMTQGEVVQTGSAQALFEAPEHTFVGYFIGNPGMNSAGMHGRGRPGAGRRPVAGLVRTGARGARWRAGQDHAGRAARVCRVRER